MARPGISYLEVAEAASQLSGQGKNPTIEQIRILLGTGSSTTLAKYLRQWKDNQGQGQKLVSRDNLPKELLALVKGLWERILGQSEEKIAALENSYQHQLNELTQAVQKYKNNNRRWQQLYDQWAEEKSQLCRDKAKIEKMAQMLQQNCAAFSDKQSHLSQQLQEKQERIKELHRLHQQTQLNLEHFRESTRTQRLLEQQRSEKEKEELRAQIKEHKDNNGRLKNESAKIAKQHQGLQKAQALLTEINADLKARHEAERSKVLDLQTESRLLAAHLAQVKQQLAEALKQGKQMEQEKWVAIKEKTHLEGQFQQLQGSIKLR